MAYHKKNSRWLIILCLLVLLVGCTPATPSWNEDSSSSSSEITPSPMVGTDDWFMDETKRSDPAYLEEVYNYGFELMGGEYYVSAVELYTFLGDYKDAPTRLMEAQRQVELAVTVDFKLDLCGEEYKIIDRDGDYVLLQRVTYLFEGVYHHTNTHVTWSDSSLRAQLQHYYEETFTPEIKERIRPTTHDGVTDSVFILSKEEVGQHLTGISHAWLRCETEFLNGRWLAYGYTDYGPIGEYQPIESLGIVPFLWYYQPLSQAQRRIAQNRWQGLPDNPMQAFKNIDIPEEYTMSYDEYFSRERERISRFMNVSVRGYNEKFGEKLFTASNIWDYVCAVTYGGVVTVRAERELVLVSPDMATYEVLYKAEHPIRDIDGDGIVVFFADGNRVFRVHVPSRRIDWITTLHQFDADRSDLNVFMYPGSNTDIGVSFSIPGSSEKNYRKDGFRRWDIFGGVYSTLTDTFYPVDIYDAFPDFSPYFEAREADLVRMGLDPDALLYYREHER